MISVDIEIGSKVVGRLPITYLTDKKMFQLDFVSGIVDKIEYRNSCKTTKIIQFDHFLFTRIKLIQYKSDQTGQRIRVADWRIVKFEFGGISIQNPKYDKIACDDSDKYLVDLYRKQYRL